jgi:hypothetical protein
MVPAARPAELPIRRAAAASSATFADRTAA